MNVNLHFVEILERLEKAVHSGNITEIVPEDLEIEAHTTLWRETQPGQLTLLKMMPEVRAEQIAHQYSKITSYGFRRNSGFFGERSLPPETNFAAQRVTNNIRLMGEIGPTFLLAALEKTQRALGTQGAQNIERVALRRNVLEKKCRNLYFSETTTHKDGVNSVRFKGLAQLIREGTDGTTGTSPYGSHFIDLRGAPMSVAVMRERIAQAITQYGAPTCLFMDPFVRSDMEASLDPAQRLNLPAGMKPYVIGQYLAGLQTQGGVTWFETDNTLTPIYSRGKYESTLIAGAPTTKPTATAVAQADTGATSQWDATYAGDVFYVVTEIVDELEGQGTRAPSGTGVVTVNVGEEVLLTITPGNPTASGFKVYRGTDAALNATDAWFIFEVANTGGGAAITAIDNNDYLPNTSWAFMLNIQSGSERAIHNGVADSYWKAADSSADFLSENDREGNTIANAALGPSMGIMALASVLAHVDRPLVYSATSPECRNPFQNYVFYNIGRA